MKCHYSCHIERSCSGEPDPLKVLFCDFCMSFGSKLIEKGLVCLSVADVCFSRYYKQRDAVIYCCM